MKLTFKDLKQQKFTIDAEPSDKISDVKQKIAEEQKWEASLLKLIYSGKVLQDDNTVESYNIEEKGYIVCMIQKPKTTAASSSKAAPSTPTPAAPQTPAAPAAPAPAAARADPTPATPSPAAPASAAGATSGTPSTFNDPSALTLGAAQEEAISNMEAMGFERAEINRAMRAAFFNPDRAVEYLLNGIPESALREQAQPQQNPRSPGAAPAQQQQAAAQPRAAAAAAAAPAAAPAAAAAATTGGGEEPQDLFQLAAQAGQGGRGAGAGAGGAGGASGLEAGSLDFLRNNPQFQQLRQLVQQQPQMLEPILQQVGAGNPQLAALIASHQNEFIQLLYEDGDEDTPLPPGAQAISVTEDEREAIERLCRLGFERDLVIQAYFACDKNEELAANFLFDQPEDDEPPQ